jgi:hypothetical protein
MVFNREGAKLESVNETRLTTLPSNGSKNNNLRKLRS